jgi:peptidoglycan/xylan/chitin deacetylase (PgdA/CDA1 family)
MIEGTVLLLVVTTLVFGGLAIWRLATGRPRHRLEFAFRTFVLGTTAAALVAATAWTLINARTLQLFGGIVPRVGTSLPVVALTFDDGPSPQSTEQVLAILREQGVRATFFVTGQAVERHMEAARRIVEEGHELGNHSYSHQRMILKSHDFIAREIEVTDHLIRTAGYEGDIHFRPPYSKKLLLLPYYLQRTERLSITFDIEPESNDDSVPDADAIIDRVAAQTRPGSIILMHIMSSTGIESREAIPGIIQRLRERSYSFVTVSQLLALR